jgi:hypothetical protein
VISHTPPDASDIAMYTRFSHPIHLLMQSLNWLIQREKLIIQKIVPSRHGSCSATREEQVRSIH